MRDVRIMTMWLFGAVAFVALGWCISNWYWRFEDEVRKQYTRIGVENDTHTSAVVHMLIEHRYDKKLYLSSFIVAASKKHYSGIPSDTLRCVYMKNDQNTMHSSMYKEEWLIRSERRLLKIPLSPIVNSDTPCPYDISDFQEGSWNRVKPASNKYM